MKIELQQREIELKYLTDKFNLGFEVQGSWNDQTNQWERHPREVLTQLEVELNLSERTILPIPIGSTNQPTWYVVYVNHFDDLNLDGTYQYPRAHPEGLDIHIEGEGKNVIPAIEAKIRDAFPGYNVGLNIGIHSALQEKNYPGDYYDERDVFRSVLQELVGYVVNQGLSEIAKHKAEVNP